MADRKAITALGSLTTPATGDELIITDVSDTTDGASGTTKKITRDNLLGATLVGLEGVTASAAELNILDGATLDVNELNILDGVTSTTEELNILDGVTSTTAELNKLDGITGDVVDTGSAQTVTGAKALDGGWSSSGQPFVSVRRSANQTIPTASATAAIWDTEVSDNCSGWAPSPNPTRVTAPSDGVYLVIAWWSWASSGLGTRLMQLRLNNTVQTQWRLKGADNYATATLSYMHNVTTGQYFELFLYQDTGGNLDIGTSGMTMFKMA